MQQSDERVIDVGSAGYHPPSAMKLGVTHSESGCGFAPQDDVIAELARQLYTWKNRTISPALVCLGLASGMDLQRTGHVAACGGDSKRHDQSHAGLPAEVSKD
jgi:hypothetical protein